MNEKDKLVKTFKEWNKRCKGNYIKAICKPCWELKYCPYGSLVEYFPLGESGGEENCRIFGHICPVFYVAEPFTETKETRNISRNIPMPVKRKVERRDRGICDICKKVVEDDDINYDHIIPWSKGGPSNESNLRILCSECNKKRGNSYEEKYLVTNAMEWRYNSLNIGKDELHDLLTLFLVAQELKKVIGELTKNVFCEVIKAGDPETEEMLYMFISSLIDVFDSNTFFISVKKKEKILRYRWGIIDGNIHSIEEVCNKYRISKEYYIEVENLLLRQIGLVVDSKVYNDDYYTEISVDSETVKLMAITRLYEMKLLEDM